ncbi:MAG: Uracil-DNA glycosylase [Candidatus Anoxychlamydiales bacterium]|nr:Uracil-DNA glycosylase [Candidatus Anoxychlamydiales bacterium]
MKDIFLMEKDWASILKDEFEKKYFKDIQFFLSEEIKSGYEIYPPKNDIFKAFCLTPFEDVKIVIMGQDPYHQKNQAHGLSFSVPDNINIPPSLRNIYKEIEEDLKIKMSNKGNLTLWAKQGVLLLNATLTVRKSSPKSHYGIGWEGFTDKVIDALASRKDPIVFMLWGASAKEKIIKILQNKSHPHLVLSCAHPSFYSVKGFFGCRHFSKANAFLKKHGKDIINFQIP